MTRGDVLAWLDSRRPAPPTTLRERLQGAVHDSPLDLASHLAQLGSEL